jgi:hypothetical protein
MSYCGTDVKRSDTVPGRTTDRIPQGGIEARGLREPCTRSGNEDEANATASCRPALTLLGLLVHEISQPVTTLLGEVELALRAPRGEQEMGAALERCFQSLERVSKLIADFRAVGEMNTGVCSPSPLVKLISGVVETAKPAAELWGCQLKWSAPAEIYIKTDPEVLRAGLLKILAKTFGGCPIGKTIDLELMGGPRAAVLRLSYPRPERGKAASRTGLEADPEWILAAGMIQLLGGSLKVGSNGDLGSRTSIDIMLSLSGSEGCL